MTVNPFSTDSVYDPLVPPSKCPIDPRILVIRESLDDRLVEYVVVEIVVLITPELLGG